MLKHHQGLRALKERRRAEEIQSKLADEKPLEDILKSLLEHSPTLSALFLQGQRAANPFKTLQVTEQDKEFQGKTHPTYFKSKGKEYGRELRRDCHINQRFRIVFETDAVNDYFSRNVDNGEFSLFMVAENGRSLASDYVGPNLQNGVAVLTVQLPANCVVGDLLRFEAVVSDPTLVEAFKNVFLIDVSPENEVQQGGGGGRQKPPAKESGDEREISAGIALPNIIPISELEWATQTPPFDKYTALVLGISDAPGTEAGTNGGETHDIYDFKINMDNMFLKSELKSGGDEVDLISARWKYSLVLIGLAMLHDDAQTKKTCQNRETETDEDESGESIDSKIAKLTRAVAPVLLPMIDSLGAMETDGALAVTASGEAT